MGEILQQLPPARCPGAWCMCTYKAHFIVYNFPNSYTRVNISPLKKFTEIIKKMQAI
jgi:hypothetical protein